MRNTCHTLFASALATLMVIGAAGEAAAQAGSMVWGEIPREHVVMDRYPADTSAAAVFLGYIGEVDIQRDYSRYDDIHARGKVFTEAGYDIADVEFVFRHDGGRQRLRSLEGRTYVPRPDGTLDMVPLRDSDIFTEEDGPYTYVRFTMPALQPGAIFEYRYSIHTRGALIIPDWRFQARVPVLWSEYRAGFYHVTLTHRLIGNPRFSFAPGDPLPRGAPRRWNSMFRWVMEDVPALPDEPYAASINDHAYAIRFDLTHVGRRSVGNTWDEIDEWLLRNTYFGQRMRSSRAVRDRVAAETQDAASDLETLHRIYDFVRTNVEWDGRFRPYAFRTGADVLSALSGSSGEINLLLAAMLREAGIDADPVLVSTRGHGRVDRDFTSERQFDHVVVAASLGAEEFLLDATDRYRPVGMLPVEALNGDARLISESRSRWITLEPGPSRITLEIDGRIGSDGRLAGVLRGTTDGYIALFLRHRWADLLEKTDEPDLDEQGQAVLDTDELTFSGVVIDGLDAEGELSFELEFQALEAGRAMGHVLTVGPVVGSRMQENPFVSEQRTFPVDFAFPLTSDYRATLEIPEGFVVDDVPPHVRLSTENNGLVYGRMVTLGDGTLQVRRMYTRRQAVFRPHQYPSLREVYTGLVAADAAMVVLTRESPEAAEVAGD